MLASHQAGTDAFELKNFDGLFDEENPDSDLAGLIRPGIQVQLRDGVTPLWTGVLDDIPTQFNARGQGNHITTVSALGILTNTVEPVVSGGSSVRNRRRRRSSSCARRGTCRMSRRSLSRATPTRCGGGG